MKHFIKDYAHDLRYNFPTNLILYGIANVILVLIYSWIDHGWHLSNVFTALGSTVIGSCLGFYARWHPKKADR
jgi:hypothetical protein